ncbi:MAG: nucleotidyltransferase [Acetivibrio sp.]
MKITGVIVEYNPFHNGHQYHLQKARELTGADFIVAIMSGDFVQRGTPAVTDKYTRAHMALLNGADVVYELPSVYATASAETFAYGAVSHLNALENIDFLCFGCESLDFSLMNNVAKILVEEPEEYRVLLRKKLAEGFSYPIARKTSLLPLLPDYPQKELLSFLESSNNILGIEYMKALYRMHSSIKPFLLKREGALYQAEELPFTSFFPSATALRKTYRETSSLADFQNYVPQNVLSLLAESENRCFPMDIDDFSDLLYYKLQFSSLEDLLTYADITPDLAKRIFNKKNEFKLISTFSYLIKTKQNTFTRIQRVLLHILLNIKKEVPLPSYLRLLGFRKSATKIIDSSLSAVPIITKVADYPDLLKQDLACTNLYNYMVYKKFNYTIANDFIHPLVIL